MFNLLKIIIGIIITIIIETPVILIFLRKREKILLNSFLINTITNIILNGIIIPFIKYDITLFVAEFVIIIVEGFMWHFCIKDISKVRALATSLVSNVLSFVIGLIIFDITFLW